MLTDFSPPHFVKKKKKIREKTETFIPQPSSVTCER